MQRVAICPQASEEGQRNKQEQEARSIDQSIEDRDHKEAADCSQECARNDIT